MKKYIILLLSIVAFLFTVFCAVHYVQVALEMENHWFWSFVAVAKGMAMATVATVLMALACRVYGWVSGKVTPAPAWLMLKKGETVEYLCRDA